MEQQFPIEIYGQRRELFEEVELFHEQTKFAKATFPIVRRRMAKFLRNADCAARRKLSRKSYRYFPRTELPAPRPITTPFHELVAARRSIRQFKPEPTPLDVVSDVLHHSVGRMERSEGNGSVRREAHRPYASAGALYPIECYLVTLNVAEVPTGVWHYESLDHSLRLIRKSTFEEIDTCLLGNTAFIRDASFLILLTASFWRTCEKYGPRGYVFALIEAGEISQTATLAGFARGLGSVAWGGYFDDAVHQRLLGINGVDETMVASLIMGVPNGS
jgi:SagB-type dehydrogenase family enzyme